MRRKRIAAVVIGISLLLVTSASAKKVRYTKALAIFKADGVTTTLTYPLDRVGRIWSESQIKGDKTRQLKNEVVLTGNALIKFGPNGQNLSVTADKISYQKLKDGPVALFTLTGNVVLTIKRSGRDAMRFTADKATFDLRYSP